MMVNFDLQFYSIKKPISIFVDLIIKFANNKIKL